MYLFILILSFKLTTKTYRSTQPRVHIPIGGTVFSFYLFILKLSFRQTTNTDLSTHPLYCISAPTPSRIPVHQSTKFRLASQPICWSAHPHVHLMFFFQLTMNTNPCHLLPVPPSTGLYTRFIFCSLYTQAYSKLSLPLHYDAFLPAKQSDLPVDSTTRLHTHRGTCSSAYQFFFFPLLFNLRTYLRTHLLVHVPRDLPTPK